MPDITGGTGTGSVGTPTIDRAISLSGWFGQRRFANLSGVLGTHRVGYLSYLESGSHDWFLVDYADRLYPWAEYCGIPGGIPTNRTQYGSTLTTANTTAQINSAIAACPENQYVLLAAGTYSVGQITFGKKTGVTLRGAGAGQTILQPTVSNSITSSDIEFSEAAGIAVASGYTKGSMSIVLSSAPSAYFAAGNIVCIAEDADSNKWSTGVGTYYRVGFPAGSSVYALDQNRVFRHLARITSVVGNTVNIATPLPMDFGAALNVKAYAQTSSGPAGTLCGIEDLTIDGQNLIETAIHLYGADRCWAKDVELKNIAGSDIGQIKIYRSVQCEIRRCYIHDCTSYPSQADGYATGFNFGSSNCLLIDTIADRVASLNQTNGSSSCAFIYNYSRDTMRASAYSKGININHGPHSMMCLIEGNVMSNFTNDGYHGSSSHMIMLRNHINGLNSAGVPLNPMKLLNLCRGSYYQTVVGNVLGDPSWNPLYYDLGTSGSSPISVYALGFPGTDTTSMSPYTSVPWTNWAKSITVPDADVLATLLRRANYDYFHGSTFDGNPVDYPIPQSLFYSSKPAFFGSLAWPAIGPDLGTMVNDIPATARWDRFVISGTLADLFADEA